MKKLIKFRFLGEDIDLADDHPPESQPEKLYLGGGALFLTQENHHHGETSSNRSAVDDDVDTELGLSISPNSTISPLWWSQPESDGVDSPVEDDVRTKSDSSTLSLSPPAASTISYSSASPPLVIYNPTPLRWFRPQSNGVDSPADDFDQTQVNNNNTTLNSSPLATTIKKSRNSNYKRGRSAATTATAAADGGAEQKKKKRSRPHDAEASTSAAGEDGKKKKRRHRNEDQDQRRPLVPVKEIGGVLLRTVESRGGSRPEILDRKKLQASDVKRSLNRVFLSREERVMGFLREEEAAVVTDRDKKGLTVVGIDGGGNVYENLVMTEWPSLEIIVIKSDWMKVVDANKAQKDDVMEIWGYRENGKPCLAVNIWRERQDHLERDGDHSDNHAASTSTSSNGNGAMKT